jgi:predicted  nucleic acid-binding Zn-ribbon protein
MITADQVERQIQTLLSRVKGLEDNNNSKDRIIANLSQEVHQLQAELGSQRKKIKSEVQRLESKISAVR